MNRTRSLPLAARLMLVASTSATTLAGVALDIELRARAIAPGEPVRIEVISPLPLASASGSFAGNEVFLTRLSPATGETERWAGWSMVGLGEPAGLASVEVQGRTGEGHLLYGSRAVAIVAKTFPEERLDVEPRYVEPPAELAERLARESALVASVYARRGSASLPERPFVRPVQGAPTSTFGTRRLYNGRPRAPHPGLDLRAATGTPVRCGGPGEVALARELYFSGGTVIVDHGGGLFTVYAHLSGIQVQESAKVEAGQVLGVSGATGRVTGPHLHWGAKIGDRPFDPLALLDPALFR